MEITKESKLSKTLKNIPGNILIGISGAGYVVNEAIQQIKHGYFHLTKENHDRMERGDWDSDAFFDNYSIYVKK